MFKIEVLQGLTIVDGVLMVIAVIAGAALFLYLLERGLSGNVPEWFDERIFIYWCSVALVVLLAVMIPVPEVRLVLLTAVLVAEAGLAVVYFAWKLRKDRRGPR